MANNEPRSGTLGMCRVPGSSVVTVFLAFAFAAPLYAQCDPAEDQKLTVSDGDERIGFGSSVSISGDVLVVGAPGSQSGAATGAAYIFRDQGTGWIGEWMLVPSDGESSDEFGIAASVDGNVAIVGAPVNDFGTGAAYIYRHNGEAWIEEQKLTASDGLEMDFFGISVDVNGDVAIIGAWRHDGNSDETGAAYIFVYDGVRWIEEQKLMASDGVPGEQFGSAVAINNEIAIVGESKGQNDVGAYSGAAYIYRFNGIGWREEQKLTASDSWTWDYFGDSVSLSEDRAIVGAYQNDANGVNAGSAYIFRFDGDRWIEEQKLVASDGARGEYFGWSVSTDGTVAVIGTIGDDGNGPFTGSAYVFRFDGSAWNENQRIIASDGAKGDEFGTSVSVSDDRVIIGAVGDDDSTGSAYIFDLNCDCLADCDADGIISTLDFICFLNLYSTGDPLADCDGNGMVNTLDFLCFLNAFNLGC